MLTAGSVAALGFLSLVVFEITTIRTFGVFTGLGILSALVLEMTFIPALRSLLPAPGEREGQRERERRLWDRVTETLAGWVIGPGRRRIYVAMAGLVVLCGIGVARVVTDNSIRSYFFAGLAFQEDDRALNARLGGTNTLYLLVEGAEDDAIKAPEVLRAMAATQRFLEQDPAIGKTVSLADFVRRMNQAMHGDDPAYDGIPETRELRLAVPVAVLAVRRAGDFDAYVDYGVPGGQRVGLPEDRQQRHLRGAHRAPRPVRPRASSGTVSACGSAAAWPRRRPSTRSWCGRRSSTSSRSAP